MVLVTLGLKSLAPPDPFAAALLAGLCARSVTGGSGAGGDAGGGGGTVPVEVPDAGPKGPSDEGGRDELVESRASFSACSIASACRRHSNSTRASGLSASKKRRSMPERSTGPLRVMPPIESELAG